MDLLAQVNFPGLVAILKDWGSAGAVVFVVWIFLHAGKTLLTKFEHESMETHKLHIAAAERIAERIDVTFKAHTEAVKSLQTALSRYLNQQQQQQRPPTKDQNNL